MARPCLLRIVVSGEQSFARIGIGWLLAALVFVSAAAPPVFAQFENVAVRPVACDDEDVPGFEGLEVRANPINWWRLGPGGHAVGEARLVGEGIDSSNDDVLVVGNPDGSLEVALREGGLIDGEPLRPPRGPYAVDASGRIVWKASFEAVVDPALIPILAGAAGAMAPLAIDFDPVASGYEADASIVSTGRVQPNSNGDFLFRAGISGSEKAIFTSSGAGSAVIGPRTGVTLPGMPEQVEGGAEPIFASVGNPILEASGDLVFSGRLFEDDLGATQIEGVWRFSGGTVSEMLGEGRAAPGLDGLEISSAGPVSAGGGKVALETSLSGPGVDSSNATAFWIAEGSSLSLVAREGDAVPVPEGAPTGVFTERVEVHLSEAGAALVPAVYSNGAAVWAWNGALEPLVALGAEVPGYPGNTWREIVSFAINPAGRIAIVASHQGAPPRQRQHGLWVADPGGPLQEVEVPESVTLPDGRTVFGGAGSMPLVGFNARNEILIEYSFGCMAVISLDGRLDLGSIEGRVELDLDGDGDFADEDQGLEGVEVSLLNQEDGETVEATVSGGGGYYRFEDLPEGNYVVGIESLPGFQSTGDSDDAPGAATPGTVAIALGADQDARGLDFLEWRSPGEETISGFVLDDPNGDGMGDDAVAGVEGVSIRVIDAEFRKAVSEVQKTAEDGAFAFTELPAGDYFVLAGVLPDDIQDVAGRRAKFTADNIESRVPAARQRVSVPLSGPVQFLTAREAVISGAARDADDSATGLEDAKIELFKMDAQSGQAERVDRTTTSHNGSFSFFAFPGEYLLQETDPPGYLSVSDTEGAETDNQISLTVRSGTNTVGHEFADKRGEFAVFLRRLDASGVSNLNKPTAGSLDLPAIEPILPVADAETLAAQPIVLDGLVADGVSPLLIQFCALDAEGLPRSVRWECKVESGGSVRDGIMSHMLGRSAGEWVPATSPVNQVELTSSQVCDFALIEALKPEWLVFDVGSKEITLSFKLYSDDASETLLAEQSIRLRRPPLALISQGPWSDAFVEQLTGQIPRDFQVLTDIPIVILEVEFLDIEKFWSVLRFDAVVQGNSVLDFRRLFESHGFRREENLYRGDVRRAVLIGGPNNGTNLTPYLLELEARLQSFDGSGRALRFIPGTSQGVALWDALGSSGPSIDLVDTAPRNLDPRSRFFSKVRNYDPETKVYHLATGVSPSEAKAFKSVGLVGAVHGAVFPGGSDGLVDRKSVFAASRSNANVDHSSIGFVAHGEPAAFFGADTTQTRSPAVASKVELALEALEDFNFRPYRHPKPKSAAEMEAIVAAAASVPLADLVDIEFLPAQAQALASGAKLFSTAQAVDEDARSFVLGFAPPESQPIEGEVFWTAEVYGPDGASTSGVLVEPDPGDPARVTVSVDSSAMGDVVLFLSYETSEGRLAFAKPKWIAHQAPLASELERLELQPASITLRPGERFEPDLVTVYSDGTRLLRWIDPLSLESVASSDPAAVSVERFPSVRALGAGAATLTVEAFGKTAVVEVAVEAEPQRLDFETWKSGFFSAEELEDPAVSGNDVDLDGDSLNLLLEFATGGNPRVADLGNIPRIRKIASNLLGERVAGFRVSTNLEDVRVVAETSSDLEAWTELAELADDASFGGDAIAYFIEGEGYREVFFELAPDGASFYRLSVKPESP